MLIINFSYNPSDYFNFVVEFDKSQSCHLLDISDVLNNDQIEHRLPIGSLQENESLKNESTEDMINTVGVVSLLPLNENEQIRDINLDGLNLFWQTYISEKYPTRSFLANLFYLKSILKSKLPDFGYKRIAIILPSQNTTCYKNAISCFFYKTYGVRDVIFNIQTHTKESFSFIPFLKKIKFNISETFYFKNKLKCVPEKDKKEIKNYIVVTIPSSTWREDEDKDRVLGFIKDNEKNAACAYIPYFKDLFGEFRWSNAWDSNYIHYFPTNFQVLKSQFSKFSLRKKISKIHSIDFSLIDFLDADVICYELNNVLFRNYNHINYLWMKNFFTSVTMPVNCFYYTEFYIQSGRVISQAINRSLNNNINSYAYQHGNIYNGHTVYHLTKKEIECTQPFNGLPKPKHFIVWGQYFKDLLNKNQAFSDSELIIAGNPNYTKISETYKADGSINKEPVFLWCTSFEFVVKNELEIIKPFLDSLPSYKLIIRCHPGHQIQTVVLDLCKQNSLKNIYLSEDKNVFDAISKVDFIFTAMESTIFLDALVLNKFVFQFQTEALKSTLIPSPNATLVTTSDELKASFMKLRDDQSKKDFTKDQNILYLKSDVWNNMLASIN